MKCLVCGEVVDEGSWYDGWCLYCENARRRREGNPDRDAQIELYQMQITYHTNKLAALKKDLSYIARKELSNETTRVEPSTD